MKLTKKKSGQLFYVLWPAAVLFFAIGMINFHGSVITKAYHVVPGCIQDVEATKVLQKMGYVTRYNYTIVWYDQDETFKKHINEALSAPDENITEVWASRDNSDVSLSSSIVIRNDAYKDIWIFAILFFVGLFFFRKSKSNRIGNKESLENVFYSMIVCTGAMIFGAILMLAIAVTGKMNTYELAIVKDLGFIFAGLAITSLIIVLKIKNLS